MSTKTYIYNSKYLPVVLCSDFSNQLSIRMKYIFISFFLFCFYLFGFVFVCLFVCFLFVLFCFVLFFSFFFDFCFLVLKNCLMFLIMNKIFKRVHQSSSLPLSPSSNVIWNWIRSDGTDRALLRQWTCCWSLLSLSASVGIASCESPLDSSPKTNVWTSSAFKWQRCDYLSILSAVLWDFFLYLCLSLLFCFCFKV